MVLPKLFYRAGALVALAAGPALSWAASVQGAVEPSGDGRLLWLGIAAPVVLLLIAKPSLLGLGAKGQAKAPSASVPPSAEAAPENGGVYGYVSPEPPVQYGYVSPDAVAEEAASAEPPVAAEVPAEAVEVAEAAAEPVAPVEEGEAAAPAEAVGVAEAAAEPVAVVAEEAAPLAEAPVAAPAAPAKSGATAAKSKRRPARRSK